MKILGVATPLFSTAESPAIRNCVYDAAFQLVAASHAYGDTQAVLPEGGWVVFTGDVGAQFQIAMDR